MFHTGDQGEVDAVATGGLLGESKAHSHFGLAQ
jgi:hypothetical protein